MLQPSRHRILTSDISRVPATQSPLRKEIEEMIARRQASLRPGETPYRPMIRFRVWPNGVRTYYLAYPALESLGVPMTRENVPLEESDGAKP